MAAMLACVQLLSVLVIATAYPYYDQWSPREIAQYLSIQQGQSPVEDLSFDTDGQGIGQVSGVDMDSKGDLYIFHRADRVWDASTFDFMTNVLYDAAKLPIAKDTIFKVNPSTGKLIQSFGANTFNVPHGLKFDSKDNMWVTDVGRHQVMRIPSGSTTPDLVLGEKFVPGSDEKHFCKPTDVAVASNGDFFVSDGYCNSRVMKFSADGKLQAQWGTSAGMSPYSLRVPHSITLVEELDLVCVADREHSRAMCYNAGLSSSKQLGTFNRTLVPEDDVGKVYAIYYNKPDQEVIVAASSPMVNYLPSGQAAYSPRAYTYSLAGQLEDSWAYVTPITDEAGPSLIHDLCASIDGQSFYLADLDQHKVVKYTKPSVRV